MAQDYRRAAQYRDGMQQVVCIACHFLFDMQCMTIPRQMVDESSPVPATQSMLPVKISLPDKVCGKNGENLIYSAS